MDDVVKQSISDYPTQPRQRPDKTQWSDSYQLVDFCLPEVADIPTIHKQFKVRIQCFDKATRTSFTKTIFFGNQNDYVWTGDKSSRLKKLASMTHKQNPLHSHYWTTQLCFYSQDFKANLHRMVDHIMEKRIERLNRLKPKRDMKQIAAKRLAQQKQKKMIV